jgi:CRISPR system Cascade subunit CasA
LARAPELREVDDSSPLVTISLYRLLLAILHRNFGPKDMETWHDLWQRGAWDTAILDAYFDHPERYHRFDLFGERPFYQSASLDTATPEPIALLAHELASGNNATLFDHTFEAEPPTVSAAQAARYLLAYHGFAFGGRITGEAVSGKAGPLVKEALVLVRGATLFETLALNLHRYNDTHPFLRRPDDAPAWERAVETQDEERRPSGYLDLLTWQSRRVRLIPDHDNMGNTVVRFVSVRKGYRFPVDFYRSDAETMVAFQAREKPGARAATDPYPPVALQEDRAVWRDSHALFESSDEKRRPKMLDWLNDLADEDYVARHKTRSLDIYGLCADQAKAILWRHERLPLPLVYLNDKELRDSLKLALELADGAAGDLSESVRELAKKLRTPELAKHLAPTRLYWAHLETRFLRFLSDAPVNRSAAFATWHDEVRSVAVESLMEAVRGLDTSARLLEATVVAERVLYGRLRKRYQPSKQGDAA